MLLVLFQGGFIIKVLAYYSHISISQKKRTKIENGDTYRPNTHINFKKKLAKSTKTSNNPIGFGTNENCRLQEKEERLRFIHE